MDKILFLPFFFLFSSQNGCISAGMTDFIAAQADLILPELVVGMLRNMYGTKSTKYCSYCYTNGEFKGGNVTLKEFSELSKEKE